MDMRLLRLPRRLMTPAGTGKQLLDLAGYPAQAAALLLVVVGCLVAITAQKAKVHQPFVADALISLVVYFEAIFGAAGVALLLVQRGSPHATPHIPPMFAGEILLVRDLIGVKIAAEILPGHMTTLAQTGSDYNN